MQLFYAVFVQRPESEIALADIPHIKVDRGYLILILDFGAGLSLLPARTKRFFIASPAILSVFLGYINSFIALSRNRRYLSLGSQEEVAFQAGQHRNRLLTSSYPAKRL